MAPVKVDKLSLENVPGVVEREVALRPGFNLIVVPTENLRRLVVDLARKALEGFGQENGHLPERTVNDAQVLSSADLKIFNVLARSQGVSRAAMAAGLLGGWRLPGVTAKLRESTEAVWNPDGEPGPELATMLDELEAVRREMRNISEKLAQAPRLHALLQSREQRLAKAERAEAERAQRLAHGLKLQAARNELTRFERLEVERNLRARLKDFPDDGVAALEVMSAELDALRATREPAMRAYAELRRELEPLRQENVDLVEAELRTLLDVHRERTEQAKQLQPVREAFAERKKKLESQVAANKVPKLEVGDALLEANGFLSQRETAWRTAKRVRERIESEVRRLTGEVAKLPAISADAVGTRIQGLQRLQRAREEKERISGEIVRVDGALRSYVERSWSAAVVPERYAWWKWAVLGAGVLLVLIGAVGVLPSERWGDACAALGALVVLGVGVDFGARMAKRWRGRHELADERARLQRRTALEDERVKLERRSGELERELLAASTEAGIAPSAPISRIELKLFEAEREAETLARRQRLSVQLEIYAALLASAVSDETRSKVDRDVADSRVSGLERRFASAATGTDPAAMLRQRLLDIRTEETSLVADQRACDDWMKVFVEQVPRHGVRTRDLRAATDALVEKAESLRLPSVRMRELDERRSAIDSQLAGIHRLCGEKAEAIHTLMEPWGCIDETSFRARAAEAERYRTAVRELTESAQRIEETVGLPLEDVRQQLAEFSNPEKLAARVRRYQRSHTRGLARVYRATKRRDATRHKLETWGNAEQLAVLEAQGETLESATRRVVEQFAVDRLALGLVRRMLHQWEKESRPLAVALASESFGRLTGGAYVHIDVEAERPDELVVQDSRWRKSGADSLPPSAKEALFIAFRLAALQEAAVRRPALPVLVDQLFTARDTDTVRNGVGVLARLAEKHQVILVTTDARLRRLLEPGRTHLVEVHATAAALAEPVPPTS